MKKLSPLEVILVRYPFSDFSASKIRPAVVISAPSPSHDIFIVPLTSKTINLQPGEFVLNNWKESGLNVVSAVKRGVFTISDDIVIKSIGFLHDFDAYQIEKSVKSWMCWK